MENVAKAAEQVLNDCHKIVLEAEKARKTFYTLAKIFGVVIVTAIIFCSGLSYVVSNQGKELKEVRDDYMPFWVVTALMQNQTYQNEDIIVQLGGNKEKAKEIAEKYIDFQNRIINTIAQMRGGTTNIVRGLKQDPSKGGGQ
jgi:hypothetical protein